MMKYLPLIICVAFSDMTYAQQTTGGCGYGISHVCIGPGADSFTLYSGTIYTATMLIYARGIEFDPGLVTIKIDRDTIGSLRTSDYYSDVVVPLEKFYLDTGRHRLWIFYDTSPGCGGVWSRYIIIKDSVKTDTVHPQDTIVTEPQPQQIDTSGHITIYPMPARGEYFTINGLRPSETDYDLRIIDMQGGAVSVGSIWKSSTSATVSTDNIPNGFYIVLLQTPERNTRMKLQLLR